MEQKKKTKWAILVFFNCGEIVKNSIVLLFFCFDLIKIDCALLDHAFFWCELKRISGGFPACFTEFSKFNDINIWHYSKRVRTCKPTTSCVRDQNATTVPTRHMWERGYFEMSPIHASVIY